MVVGSNPAVLIILKETQVSFKFNNFKKHKISYIRLGWITYYTILCRHLNLTYPYLKYEILFSLKNLKNHMFQNFQKFTYKSKPLLLKQQNLNSTINLVQSNVMRNKLIRFEEGNILYNLYNVYVKFSFMYVSNVYKVHQEYKLFFQISLKSGRLIINPTQLYKRWVHTYNFLINLFYYKSLTLIFGPKSLKDEVLSFNWSSNIDKTHLFKQNSPHFMFSDTAYGMEALVTFIRFKNTKVNSVILLDVLPHKRNLYYLRIMNIYTIGLIPSNIDPWKVHYPIPTFNLNLFIQYYFIKFFIFIRQQSTLMYYRHLKRIWQSI